MQAPKSLPFSLDSEKAFLCCLVLSPDLIDLCDTLNPKIFYIPANATLFRMLVDLRFSGTPIDFVMCKKWLKDSGQLEAIGDIEYLNEIFSFIPTSAPWEHYLKVIKEYHVRRETIQNCQRLIQQMHDTGTDFADSIQSTVEHNLSAIVSEVRQKPKTFSDIMDQAMQILETPLDRGVYGIEFMITDLDAELLGVRSGEQAVVCGEVSDGKTALALQAGICAAISGKPVAIFSFEMSSIQLAFRIISTCGKIPMRDIRRRQFVASDQKRMPDIKQQLSKLPISIEDSFDQNIDGLISRCHQIHAKTPLKLVIVDYIQLVTPASRRNGTREMEVSDISRKLKKMSVELDLAVIALSQLNDSGKMRESRAISQDADIILRIEASDRACDSNTEGAKSIVIDKNRGGPRGARIPVRFVGDYVMFEDGQPVPEDRYP